MRKYLYLLVFLLCASPAYAGTLVIEGDLYLDEIAIGNENGVALHRYMVLGDSITVGAGDIPGYRLFLWDLLQQPAHIYTSVGSHSNGNDLETFGSHEGWSGQLTSQILSRTTAVMWAYKPSMVLYMGGTNDADQSIAAATVIGNIVDTIAAIRAVNPFAKIFIATIIPSQLGWMNVNIDAYNTLLSSTLTTMQLTDTLLYRVDQNAALLDTDNCSTLAVCMADNNHPNATGYEVIANTYAAAIFSNQ